MPSFGARAGLIALCFGNFVIGTGTLIVPGMLPQLAEGLGVSLPIAGQLVTAFAAAVCLGAPLLAGVTSRLDRRALLVAMQLVFVAGHLAAALVSSFWPMLAVRVLTSVGAALFTAQAASAAALLVPAEARGRAIAFVFLGWSIASVAGLPLGSYVSAVWGWRAGFGLVAAGAAFGAAAVWLLLPRGLRVEPVTSAMWRSILRDPALMASVGVTALFAGAGFALFAYFVPAARSYLGASPELVSGLLAVFGIAGLAGNMLAVRYMDRLGAANVVMLCLLSMLAAQLLWPWSQGSVTLVALVMIGCGLGVFACNSAQQTRLAAIAPAAASVSIALNSSAIYLGQALGPAAGGVLIAHVPGNEGYALIAAIGVPLLLAAIGLSYFASLRMRARPRGVHVQGRPVPG
ncbi:MAG TPA: MFS transporter [Burkholderiales bacterium]|nr:MFS transporter [Burkholderiales bacterium]